MKRIPQNAFSPFIFIYLLNFRYAFDFYDCVSGLVRDFCHFFPCARCWSTSNERKKDGKRERPQREYCVWMFFLFSLVAKTTHFKGTVLPKSVNLWYSKRFVELFAKAYRSNNPECNGNGCSFSISAVTRTTFIDFKSQFHIRSRLNT